METIEERALKSVPDILRINGNYVESYVLGYCDGVRAQEDMDIDKNLQDLTWQDIKRIVEIADDVLGFQTMGFLATEDYGWSSEEAYYTEVLRRYKEEE